MSLDVTVYYKACGADGKPVDAEHEVYEANLTHNLNAMAEEGGFYQAVWRPEEIGITTAAQLIPILEQAIVRMEEDPLRFKKFNPSNGWGTYEGLLSFLKSYLAVCEIHPTAFVRVSR